ncbi:MAG TPA: hypothetical protein VM344_02950 [Vitreimonas sp.]|nr:hypothetical protein [Vitreimonas sp.]
MVSRREAGEYVIAVDGEDVSVFPSFADAARAVEREDACSGDLTFLTGTGAGLAAVPDESDPSGWHLEVLTGAAVRPVRLILSTYLSGIIPAAMVDTLSDAEMLVSIADMQSHGRRR